MLIFIWDKLSVGLCFDAIHLIQFFLCFIGFSFGFNIFFHVAYHLLKVGLLYLQLDYFTSLVPF